jgi:hypothetical protein
METRVLVRTALAATASILVVGAAAPRARAQETAAAPTKQECIAADEEAQPLRRARKLIEARERLQECVAAGCPGPVREDCEARLDEVRRALPSVVLAARDAAGRSLVAVRVAVDGEAVAERLDGSPLEIDPGGHVVSFEAAGFERLDAPMVFGEGDKAQRREVTLRPLPLPEPATPPAPIDTHRATASPRGMRSSAAGSASAGSSSTRTAAYVAFGAGAVGLLVTSVWGTLAVLDKSGLDAWCGSSPRACPASSQGNIDTLQSHAHVADVGLAIAAAGAGAGAFLWLLADRHDAEARRAPTVSRVEAWVGAGLVGLRGGF